MNKNTEFRVSGQPCVFMWRRLLDYNMGQMCYIEFSREQYDWEILFHTRATLFG